MNYKWAYLVGGLGCGGQERQLYNLLSNLNQNNIMPTLILWNKAYEDFYYEKIRQLNIDLIDLSIYRNKLQRLWALRKVVNKRKYEILHSFSYYLNFVVWFACLLSAAKGLATLRSTFINTRKNTKFLNFVLNFYLPRVFISNNLRGKNELLSYFPAFMNKEVFYFSNRVSNNFFNESEMKVPSKVIKIGGAGRIDKNKRLDVIIRAFKDKAPPYIQYIHAGDGPLRHHYQNMIEFNGLSKRIHLLGQVNDIEKFYRKIDLFVHTADYEGTSNVIMEAMAMAKPIISTDCGDSSYLLNNSKGGYIIPVGDNKKLMNRIRTMINDKELITDLGAKNLNYSKKHFIIENMTNEIETIYKEITS